MSTALQIRKAIQRLLGVKDDGSIGDISKAAFSALASADDESEWPAAAAPAAPAVNVADNGDRVDDRSEKAIATLHERVRPLARALVKRCAAQGIEIRITSGSRTYEEQNALYEQGRTKPGKIVTNARGGHSNHNFGIAFDVTIFKAGQPVWESPLYRKIGEIGETIGFSWGGRWTSPVDEPHFELKPAWAADISESAMLAKLRERKGAGQDAFA